MSPLYSTKKAIAAIRQELSTPQTQSVRVALQYTLESLIRRENKLITQHHAQVDRERASAAKLQQNPEPIHCALKDCKSFLQFHPLPKWSWHNEEEKESKKVARICLDIQDLLQTSEIDKLLVRLVYAHSTLARALKAINFQELWLLDKEVRKTKSAQLKSVLLTALQQ